MNKMKPYLIVAAMLAAAPCGAQTTQTFGAHIMPVAYSAHDQLALRHKLEARQHKIFQRWKLDNARVKDLLDRFGSYKSDDLNQRIEVLRGFPNLWNENASEIDKSVNNDKLLRTQESLIRMLDITELLMIQTQIQANLQGPVNINGLSCKVSGNMVYCPGYEPLPLGSGAIINGKPCIVVGFIPSCTAP